MKQYPIEDTIIAYFDGRLTDEQSAELLHRVSVSPEIRQVFREQEMLRDVARHAARNVAVRPEIESAVFKNIAALQEEERAGLVPIPEVAKPAGFGMRRFTLAAALLAVLLAGSALYFELGRTGSQRTTMNAGVATSSKLAPVASSAQGSALATTENSAQSGNSAESRLADAKLNRSYGSYRSYRSYGSYAPSKPTASHSLANMPSLGAPVAISEVRIQSIAAVQPNAALLEPERPSLRTLASVDIAEDFQHFDVGFGYALSGFNTPADEGSHPLVTDYSGHVGYFVSPNDQIGLRATYGRFQSLVQNRTSVTGVYSAVTRSSELWPSIAGEAYYLHRFDLAGGRMIDASIGGGLFNGGWLSTVDGWLKFPVSNSVLAGVGFSLSRVHSNAPSVQDLMEEESSVPVIVSGSDVHNTMNGRLQFGLSYRF